MSTHTELLQEAEWRKCRGKSVQDYDACHYFLRTYCYIQHPERGAILFGLRPAQEEALAAMMVERRLIILKARQLGWSTLMACYALWLSFFWSDKVIVMLSKGEREAGQLLGKSTYAYQRLPDWLKERGPKRLDRNLMKITFGNGSSIESMPSKQDPARGTAVSKVIVDEWAFLDNPEEAWASIEPITDVGGSIVGLSTANGAGEFFHTFWLMAEQGKSGFKPLFYPWWANTDRDENWYEAKKESMLPWQLAQEYPENPEEAFIRSGNPVFDVDRLRALPVKEPKRYSLAAAGSWLPDALPVPTPNGVLRIWELRQPSSWYTIGADVAEGLEHGDYSSAHVLDQDGVVVAKWHGRIDPDLFGEELAMLGYYYNTAFIGVEVNNHGLTTNKTLQRLKYPRLYVRRRLDGSRKENKRVDSIGWYTTRVSKPLMIDDLAKGIRSGEITLWDQETIKEMLTFTRDEKGQMSGSPFDDQVISLAITLQMQHHGVKYRTEVSERPYYFTFDYFKDRVLEEEAKPEEPVVMGRHHVRDRSPV